METNTQLEALRKEFNERIDAIVKETDKKELGFEPGHWYKEINGKKLWFIRSVSGQDQMSFGISGYGDWNDLCNRQSRFSEFKKATYDEISSALIDEAKRRYPKGTRFVYDGVTYTCEHGFYSNHINDTVMCSVPTREWYVNGKYKLSNPRIYTNGQWAEIVSEEKIEIGGYDVCFFPAGEHPSSIGGGTFDAHTNIGGYNFTLEFWQAAKKISEHSKAKIMIGCSKQFDVSLETINKIIDRLK